MIQFGEENDAIGEKVHRLSLALLAAQDIRGVLNTVYFNLREDFAVPHVALRVWRGNGQADLPEFGPVSEASREFAASLTASLLQRPRHGRIRRGLFGEPAPTCAPSRTCRCATARPSACSRWRARTPQRFYPEMGTLYLKRLGELIAAAIAHRHLSDGDRCPSMSS